MSKSNDDFEKALEGKKIPILTLDNNWHRLFTQTDPNPKIKELENELNELLKSQGKLNTELKELKALKKKLMDEIMEVMDELGDNKPTKKSEKKLEDNKRLIEECNEKIENEQDADERLKLMTQRLYRGMELNAGLNTRPWGGYFPY